MAWPWRAEADKVAAAQLVEGAQQIVLVGEPALVFRDDGRAVAIRADPEWIAPSRASTDINGVRRHTRMMLVENLAHRSSLLIPLRWISGQAQTGFACHASPAMRERLAR